MAKIVPFKGMRFTEKAGEISKLVCPPYDIISEEQRKGYLAENPNNIIRLELPREGENQYAEAARIQKEWLDSGVLGIDAKEGIYVYEIEFEAFGETKTVDGIICRVKLEEFSKGIVLPHEETLSGAKQDRFELMKATGSNFSQVYSLYNDNENITTNLVNSYKNNNKPNQELTDGSGLIHRLWIIDDEKLCAEISNSFNDRKLYIADGHHRYETALNYRNYMREQGLAVEGDACDYMMMMLVSMSHEGLVVLPTHRIVRDIANFNLEEVLKKAEADFGICEVEKEVALAKMDEAYKAGRTAFAVCSKCESGIKYTLLSYKKDIMPTTSLDGSEAIRSLDVSVLHTEFLDKILGIDKANMAAQKNLTYTRDFDEAITAVEKGANCSIIINPTKVEQIRNVAAAGEKMPQKSTYFYPKLITGMVMNKITEN